MREKLFDFVAVRFKSFPVECLFLTVCAFNKYSISGRLHVQDFFELERDRMEDINSVIGNYSHFVLQLQLDISGRKQVQGS
jgi:hypothetical protein